MALIQYAIAKRKPKILEILLERAKTLIRDYKQIMYPMTSNTRGSLIQLAIEFGSDRFYDTVDNRCLEVIFDFFKDEDLQNANAESPLIQAICHNNSDAISLLMKKKPIYFIL